MVVESSIPAETKPKRKGARASINVEGDVDPEMVDKVLGAAGQGKGPQPSEAAKTAKFSKAIRDLNYRIIARRTYPQTLNDGTPLGDEYTIQPHEEMTEKELIDELARTRGGERWHCRVEDENGTMVAAKPLRVHGEPQLDPMIDGFAQDPMPRGRRGGPMESPFDPTQTVEETPEDALARDPDIMKAAKRIELTKMLAEEEAQQANLSEARARRAEAERSLKGEVPSNGTHDDIDKKLAAAVDAATRPLRDENDRLRKRDDDRDRKQEDEARLKASTEPLRQMLEAQQRALDALAQKMSQPAPTGPTLEQSLKDMRRDWKDDMTQYVTAALAGVTSKLDALVQTVQTLATSKGADAAITALTSIATSRGSGGPPPDPFVQMQSLMTVMKNLQTMTGPTGPTDFGSLVVEKISDLTPDVLSFIKEQSDKGQAVTTEMMDKKLREGAGKMYAALDGTLRTEINKVYQSVQGMQRGQAQAPAPAPGPAQPPVPGTASAAPRPPAPTPAAVAPPASVAPIPTAPPPAAQTAPQAEQAEYSKRVNWVLQGMLQEFKLGAQAMVWPKKALENLPRTIVNQIIYECTEDVHLYNIVKPYADPALLEQVWSFLSETNKDCEWYMDRIVEGVNWIKKASGADVQDPPVTDDDAQGTPQ